MRACCMGVAETRRDAAGGAPMERKKERVDRDGVRDDGAGDEGERDGEEDGQVARVELLRDRAVLWLRSVMKIRSHFLSSSVEWASAGQKVA